MAWFLGVITNYYATATSLTAKATHGNQSISCIAWRIWPFPARPKGACHCTFFLLNSWPNPFFSSSVWKALRFVFVGTKPHDSQKKKFIRSEAKSYETRDDTWVQMVQDHRSTAECMIQVSGQRLCVHFPPIPPNFPSHRNHIEILNIANDACMKH